LIYKLSLQ